MKMNKFNLTVIEVRLTICCCQCMSDFEIKATNRCYQSQAKISGLHILRLFTMPHVIRNNSILHRILQNKGLKQTDSLSPSELFLQNPSRLAVVTAVLLACVGEYKIPTKYGRCDKLINAISTTVSFRIILLPPPPLRSTHSQTVVQSTLLV